MASHTKKNLLPENIDIKGLARRFQTPLFVFFQERIEQNINDFLKPIEGAGLKFQVFYACKANANQTILRMVRDMGLNVEVNSPGELYQVSRAGYRPEQIMYNGVAKTNAELAHAVDQGLFCINVDNLSELEALSHITEKQNRDCRIALRLIPDIQDGGHPGLETGIYQSKFGMPAWQIPDACKIVRNAGHLKLIGIHGHIGSQLGSARSFAELTRQLKVFRRQVEELSDTRIKYFNIGGGFPVDYLHSAHSSGPSRHMAEFERRFSMNDVAQVLRDSVPQDIEILMEPGRCIVGPTAILVSTVVRKKKNIDTGHDWLLLDAGFNTLLENFSYHWYFHLIAIGKEHLPHDTGYLVGGPLCDGADIFPVAANEDKGFHRLLPASMQEGDMVAFMDTGAYTLEQMMPYNGRLLAMAVMVMKDGSVKPIRRRFTEEDLMRHDII